MHSTDQAAEPEQVKMLAWHRVEGNVLFSLFLGGGVLAMGPICGAIAFVACKHVLPLEIAFAIVGGICVVCGPTYAILKLAHSLREDASISARTDGVTFERNGKQLHMAWDDIERIELEPPTTLIFRMRGAEPFLLHERFALIETSDLAKRLEEIRRKASFGLPL